MYLVIAMIKLLQTRIFRDEDEIRYVNSGVKYYKVREPRPASPSTSDMSSNVHPLNQREDLSIRGHRTLIYMGPTYWSTPFVLEYRKGNIVCLAMGVAIL